MATSGTYSFAPGTGELVAYAYGLIGVRRTAIMAEHMADARMAMNLMFADWANKQVNLWNVETVTVPLVAGTSTYNVDPSTVMILDAYIEDSNGQDRVIYPISRTEYSSMPNKATQGLPTNFWFNRLINPTVSFWPVPRDSLSSFKYFRVRQIQDATPAGNQQPEIPYRWLDAFTFGLAARLAFTYAPDRADPMAERADKAWTVAAEQDTEKVPMYITPMLGSYYGT